MKAVAILITLCAAVLAQDGPECPKIKSVADFKYSQFQGRWFEIGHYRNEGPSIWSEDCFCSYSNVTADPLGIDEGDSIYSYVCNLDEPEGPMQAFDTLLFEMKYPGIFQQEVIPNPNFEPHTLTVADMTADYALVYRCGYYLLDEEISYTAQILSRKPTLDDAVIEKLKDKVLDLKLNPENATYVDVPHGNCTYVY